MERKHNEDSKQGKTASSHNQTSNGTAGKTGTQHQSKSGDRSSDTTKKHTSSADDQEDIQENSGSGRRSK